MIDYQVSIDFQHPEMIRVPVVQGDTESRRITFVMFNGAADYNPQTDLDTVLTVALSYLKPDGTGGQYDTMPDGETPAGSLSGNVCVLRLAPQTMSAAGLVLCNLVLFDTQGVTLQSYPFILDVKRSAGMEITSQDYYNVETIEGVSQALMHMVQSVNNATPDQHGNVSLLPWQLPYNGVIGGQQVGDVEEALDMLARMQAEIISQEIKDALINCFEHVAWTDVHGQEYVDALEQAMRSKLVSISAVFNQGTAVIYDTDDLDTLRQYLTVTELYSDATTKVVTAYTLSGTLEEGTSVVTVAYGGKTTTFDVNVTHRLLPIEYQQVEYIESANTGNGPYLRFPFTFPSDFVINAKTYQAAHISSSACPIICTNLVGQTYNSRLEIGYGGTENRMYYWSGASASVNVSGGLYGSPIELEAKYNSTSPYKEFKVTTSEDVQTASNTTANNTDLQYVLLFAMTYNPFAGRIYYMQIVGANQNPILNLVPCYRKADNVIGMYDTVGGQFYTNAGTTGTFTKGGDV